MADNKVNFLRGTSVEYEASTKDNDTFYYTTDNEKLYLGDKEITGSGVAVDDSLSDTSINPVQNKIVKMALDNKADLSDIPTELPANGGNADTVDGKHASDFASVRKITTQAEVDGFLESGIYSIEGVPTVFGSISSDFYMLIVNRYRTDVNYNSELAIPYVGGRQQGVYYRNCAGGTWGAWTNVADGGNAKTVNGLTVQTAVPANAKFTDTTYSAASVSAAGLVSTGSQTFAGSKTFQETTHIRHPAYTKGSTAPSTIQFRAYRFLDNANKQVGEFSNYVDTNNNTVSKMLAVAAASLDGKIYSQIATIINADASSIRHVCTTPTVGASSLRQIASGTAKATTSNCPDGAWYGKHS